MRGGEVPAASQPPQWCWAAVLSAPLAPTAAPEGPAVQHGRCGAEPVAALGRGENMAWLPDSSWHAMAAKRSSVAAADVGWQIALVSVQKPLMEGTLPCPEVCQSSRHPSSCYLYWDWKNQQALPHLQWTPVAAALDTAPLATSAAPPPAEGFGACPTAPVHFDCTLQEQPQCEQCHNWLVVLD